MFSFCFIHLKWETQSSYLGWICSNTVAFVVDVSQLLLQVELDPVVKSDDGPSSSRLSHKHVLKPWRIWPGGKHSKTSVYIYLFSVSILFWQSPSHTDASRAGMVPDSSREVIFRCCSRVHPPAGSSPGVKFKPNPVQLLFELCLVCRREMLLDQVFMCYLSTNKSSGEV